MPNLQELILSNIPYKGQESDSDDEDEDVLRLYTLFLHSPNLRRLWIDSMLEAFLYDYRKCPNLLALRYTNCQLTGDHFSFAAEDSAELPMLEELIVLFCSDDVSRTAIEQECGWRETMPRFQWDDSHGEPFHRFVGDMKIKRRGRPVSCIVS
jgi:hypothetical protein